jgi:hypothetical protein
MCLRYKPEIKKKIQKKKTKSEKSIESQKSEVKLKK